MGDPRHVAHRAVPPALDEQCRDPQPIWDDSTGRWICAGCTGILVSVGFVHRRDAQ